MPERPRLKYIVIDCRGVNTIDVTAVEELENLIAEYRSAGIEIIFTHSKLPVRERLKRDGWDEKFGKNIVYPTTRDALLAIGLLHAREDQDL